MEVISLCSLPVAALLWSTEQLLSLEERRVLMENAICIFLRTDFGEGFRSAGRIGGGCWSVGDCALISPGVDDFSDLPEAEREAWLGTVVVLSSREEGSDRHWYLGAPHWVVYDLAERIGELIVSEAALAPLKPGSFSQKSKGGFAELNGAADSAKCLSALSVIVDHEVVVGATTE